jgi:hypothetical protein
MAVLAASSSSHTRRRSSTGEAGARGAAPAPLTAAVEPHRPILNPGAPRILSANMAAAPLHALLSAAAALARDAGSGRCDLNELARRMVEAEPAVVRVNEVSGARGAARSGR